MRMYLSRAEFAERIGVKPATMSRYKLPEPDAMIGTVRGWLPETVDAWNADRPGKGAGAGRKRSIDIPEGLADLLDGLYAYDIGSVDSGISEPTRRKYASSVVRQLADTQKVQIARGIFGGEGYTDGDVEDFLKWMDKDL